VANLPLFIGIGDGASLKSRHGFKSFRKAGAQIRQHRFAHPHSAYVQPEAEVVVVPQLGAEPLPLAAWGSTEVGSGGGHETIARSRQKTLSAEALQAKPFG
jgi:hypothetical protein